MTENEERIATLMKELALAHKEIQEFENAFEQQATWYRKIMENGTLRMRALLLSHGALPSWDRWQLTDSWDDRWGQSTCWEVCDRLLDKSDKDYCPEGSSE